MLTAKLYADALNYAMGEASRFSQKKDGISTHPLKDPIMPVRYAVLSVLSKAYSDPGYVSHHFGQLVLDEYKRLMEDRTPGVPKELLPYTDKVRMYPNAKTHNEELKPLPFDKWTLQSRARYIMARTHDLPLATRKRKELVVAYVIDKFFSDDVKSIARNLNSVLV